MWSITDFQVLEWTHCIFYYCDKTLWSRLVTEGRAIWRLGIQGFRVHNDTDKMSADDRHGGWSWKLRAEASYLEPLTEAERTNSNGASL